MKHKNYVTIFSLWNLHKNFTSTFYLKNIHTIKNVLFHTKLYQQIHLTNNVQLLQHLKANIKIKDYKLSTVLVAEVFFAATLLQLKELLRVFTFLLLFS